MLCLNEWHGTRSSFYHGDCVEIARQLPDNSVDHILYSPPFSSVYTYSDSLRDMGNCDTDEEFIEQYACLLTELYRILRPGRICAVHCKDLVYYKSARGSAGLRDFPGDLIRAHIAAKFDLHSKVTIWKSPVVEMQRTKAHGLLYKQLRADSTISRQGCAEYLMVFRKWPRTEEEEAAIVPVEHPAPVFESAPVTEDDDDGPDRIEVSSTDPRYIPLLQWQEWASPVWMTINQTNVLNVRQARDNADEKHMCPLQLDVIERSVKLWTNPGDVVFSPFGGIASEGVGALTYGRKFVGVELKESYWNDGVRNLSEIDEPRQVSLFGRAG